MGRNRDLGLRQVCGVGWDWHGGCRLDWRLGSVGEGVGVTGKTGGVAGNGVSVGIMARNRVRPCASTGDLGPSGGLSWGWRCRWCRA